MPGLVLAGLGALGGVYAMQADALAGNFDGIAVIDAGRAGNFGQGESGARASKTTPDIAEMARHYTAPVRCIN